MSHLIELRDLQRSFVMGHEKVDALRGINLDIHCGEFVALVGASGSGKSTLMNILGCLDVPTAGTYRVAGQDVTNLDQYGLAILRQRYFGFVFQRYHLLSSMSALSNVEVPAIYRGESKSTRRVRARQLLTRLGLQDRLHHRPTEMSGGQQQRVSVARALMNGGEIILADEPTGALDSESGKVVLDLLKTLHDEGHTIILITHDMDVARHANRIVEINDGRIVSDCRSEERDGHYREPGVEGTIAGQERAQSAMGLLRRVVEATRISFRSIAAHKLRSALTLFGIVVGIVAVIAVIGLGEGGQRIVLDQINSLGANSISLLPGTGWDDEHASDVDTLSPADAEGLAGQSYIHSVSPLARDTGAIVFEGKSANGVMNGVNSDYFDVMRFPITQGHGFTRDNNGSPLQEAVIDHNTWQTFFKGQRNPVGEILVIKNAPFVIVGVIGELSGSMGQEKRPQVFVPYTSMFSRISGSQRLSEIVVRIKDTIDTSVAEPALVAYMEKRHGTRDFFTFNSDQFRRTIETTTRTLSILVSAIAAVALVVGGIGVMNIMLVSIAERTPEIGLRMAVGATPSDIMMQFLIEALAISIMGCIAGVGFAFLVSLLANFLGTPIPMVLSLQAVAIGCFMAIVIGAIFGFFPARAAARLTPLEALMRD